MIPNHKQFIEAIQEKKKVCLRFYSTADSGVIDLVCAPLDYGPAGLINDGVNRYRLWDYSSNTGSHLLVLAPEQILNLTVLGSEFDSAEFDSLGPKWSIPRDWTFPAGAAAIISSMAATATGKQPNFPGTSQHANN